jgi:antiviral defense system Shedu protein SduA
MPDSVLLRARLDFARAETELDQFKLWLDANQEFPESCVVVQLKARRDLCLLIQLAAGKGQPDRYKHEFALHGAFRADFVVGSTLTRHFVFVEFEGGSRSSIFNRRKGTAQLRDWGKDLQHGFSQISDWTWAKNDGQKSDIYRNEFGLDHMSETYVVVCGRTSFLELTDRSRLHWRSEKTTIASSTIRFWTYDELHLQASAALDVWRALRAENAGAASM